MNAPIILRLNDRHQPEPQRDVVDDVAHRARDEVEVEHVREFEDEHDVEQVRFDGGQGAGVERAEDLWYGLSVRLRSNVDS